MNETLDKSATPESPGDRDARAFHGNTAGPQLASLSAGSAFVVIGVASDHLRAASRLMLDNQGAALVFRYAVFSVLRGAMEVAALVSWLIDGQVTARERLTRSLVLMEFSRSQRERVERCLNGGAVEREDLQELRAYVEKVALTHKCERITRAFKQGKRKETPKARDLILRFFSQGPARLGDVALGLYGLMSEPTHGNVLGAMLGFDSPSDSTSPRRPTVSEPELVHACQFSGLMVVAAMTEFVEYMGWDLERWLRVAQPAADMLSQVADLVDEKHFSQKLTFSVKPPPSASSGAAPGRED